MTGEDPTLYGTGWLGCAQALICISSTVLKNGDKVESAKTSCTITVDQLLARWIGVD